MNLGPLTRPAVGLGSLHANRMEWRRNLLVLHVAPMWIGRVGACHVPMYMHLRCRSPGMGRSEWAECWEDTGHCSAVRTVGENVRIDREEYPSAESGAILQACTYGSFLWIG